MEKRGRWAAGIAAIAIVLTGLAALVTGGFGSAPATEDPVESGREIAFEPGVEGAAPGLRSTTLTELARRDEVIVTARATRSEQVRGDGLRSGFTRQMFVRGEALAGRIGRSFVVRYFGGQVRTADAVIPPDPEDPEFERGKSYLLVLEPAARGDWGIVGPAAGRYEVGRSGLIPVGSGPAQAALGGLSPQQAAARISRVADAD